MSVPKLYGVDDRMITEWRDRWQWKPKYSEKAYDSAYLPTTNPTQPDRGSRLVGRSEKPVIKRLCYGTA
jgi:hypothetical protein